MLQQSLSTIWPIYTALLCTAAKYVVTLAGGGAGRPAVIQGAMAHWPAMERWQSLDYFRRRFGSRTVPIEVNFEDVINVSDFVSVYGICNRKAWET
eukprot:scaffold63031_cov35-Prasinocladus_malaysianus.AAC.1